MSDLFELNTRIELNVYWAIKSFMNEYQMIYERSYQVV
jgi:hypothetical protein